MFFFAFSSILEFRNEGIVNLKYYAFMSILFFVIMIIINVLIIQYFLYLPVIISFGVVLSHFDLYEIIIRNIMFFSYFVYTYLNLENY